MAGARSPPACVWDHASLGERVPEELPCGVGATCGASTQETVVPLGPVGLSCWTCPAGRISDLDRCRNFRLESWPRGDFPALPRMEGRQRIAPSVYSPDGPAAGTTASGDSVAAG
ncbi:hypothetical protein J1605_010977 [Eschrichtius robustus]|uniref:Uncharacterized protein n=1 Tax=Eschrichtius robustus TaxID=9764 RepID=A0AB34GQK2_ESCRO|nr:hypothetical protein J1605_010977 [Eschrichtius robustus]